MKTEKQQNNKRILDKPQGRISGGGGGGGGGCGGWGGGGPNRTIHHSSLHGCGEIIAVKFKFSKYGKKENWTNTGKNKQ